MEQHYRTLGVPGTASLDEIRSQYWRLAKKFHPDCNPDDPAAVEQFKRISTAYALVRDVREGRALAPSEPSTAQRSGFDPVSILCRWAMWQMSWCMWPAAQTAR